MKRSLKKLNIIIMTLVLSFFSLLLTSNYHIVSGNYEELNLTEEKDVLVYSSSNYFYIDIYFGSADLIVDIGKNDPIINGSQATATTHFRKIAALAERVDQFSDNFRQHFSNEAEMQSIYYINDHVGERVQIDPLLYDLLERSLDIKEKTYGYFDISIGNIIDGWKDLIKNGAATEAEFNQKIAQIKNIEINNDENAIKLEKEGAKRYVTIQPGVKLDLGGIAKGYIVDLIAKYLKEEGINDYRVKGSDSSLKYGLHKYNNKGQVIGPYEIAIENIHLGINPFDTFDRLEYKYGLLHISNSTVTTSGDTVQNRKLYGRLMHHIISPKTKEPMTHNRILTIVNEDATLSDAMSTALFSMEDEDLETFLQSDFAIDNNLNEFIVFKAKKGEVVNNFDKTNFEYNDKTWEYPDYDPDSDDDYDIDNPGRPPSTNEGDEILKKTTRDFIIISMIVIIATLGFVMFYDAFKKIEGKVTHALVIYDSKEELVKVDFIKRKVEILEEQSDAPGYPVINEKNQTITVLGAKQIDYSERHEVIIEYNFEKRSMTVINEKSPENTCSKQGETTTGAISCLPNRVTVKFIAEKDESDGTDGIV